MSGAHLLRVLTVICLIARVASARAEVSAGLPFEPQELAEALSARVPGVTPQDLTLTAVDGRVLVGLGAQVRLVDLGNAEHAEAARVLALVVADMAREPPAVPHASLVPPQTTPVAAPSVTQVTAPQAPPPSSPPPRPDRVRLGLDLAGQRGLAPDESWSFDVGAGVSGTVWRRLLLAARVGYTGSAPVESSATGTRVRLNAFTLRPALGVRLRLLELSAGPTLMPLWMEGGEGHRDLLAGGHVQLGLWVPVVRSVRLLARVCFDLFANRTRFYAGSDAVLTTPRAMAGLALGFGWGFT